MARDPYDVVLADLRARRDDIDRLIASLEALRPQLPQSKSLSQAAEADTNIFVPGPYTGMSIVDAARAALKEKGRPTSTADLAAAIQVGGLAMKSAEPVNTVSSILHRARLSGSDIVRVGRGMWSLDEWVKADTANDPDDLGWDRPDPPPARHRVRSADISQPTISQDEEEEEEEDGAPF